MRVKFWGVRGSLATGITHEAIRGKLKKALTLATPGDLLSEDRIESFIDSLPFSTRGTFGGNTTCVELRTKDNDLVIIDAGTGLGRLSQSLMKDLDMEKSEKFHMFLTHSHWDHIQGLMFFGPFFMPQNEVTFYSSFEDILDRLRYQTPFTHFPITFDELGVTKHFKHIVEGNEYEVCNLKVKSKIVRHPGSTYSYRFTDEDGKIFVFCSDAEFNLEVMDEIGDYIEFFKDADVLVFDTQYTFNESFQRIDWGHSSAAIATDIAIKSNVKKLVLFHHDPSYDDEKMDAMTMQAIKYKDLMAPNHHVHVVTAYEGLEIEL
ncbi:MAG: MBL fold metallo-hydrolase [Leptospirales bacterium]